ncbi:MULTISPECIES: DUF4013 domain-containing protein [Halomicrobium]|uniref:DUF4013 domain-containing protein n=1 Tax=Halomicrobium mukohataei (strain ATCC 700874 / DSM 12286 / JCM 9738 / NCIMB 13541) TaxID=485914 RepID=C7P1F3_HALMD|nr:MULTISPECIES: DUF4013 domain-containing protein [Halomicrobium]ACV47161.1 conserved hypothetical protein [Halomicrobium mukohataei DSM 12286]
MEPDIEELARYPMESDDWIVTVAIGGVATLLAVFVVPIFVVTGYTVRAIRAGMEDAREPPVFDEWESLLKEGLVAAVITFVYQFVPTVVFGVFVGGSIVAFATGSETAAGLGLLGLFGGLLLWWVLAIVFGYVGLAGVANYARERSFGAGFDVAVIRTAVTSRDYAVAWLYVIALNVVVGVLAGALNVVPILGGIVGVFLSFYALIIAGWLLGDGFASATDTHVESTVDENTSVA